MTDDQFRITMISIVAIVAIVGVLGFLMNGGFSFGEADTAGQAYQISKTRGPVVAVSSAPVGAIVTIKDVNGKDILREPTPFDTKMRPGKYVLDIRAKGYVPEQATFDVTRNRGVRYDFQMVAQGAQTGEIDFSGAPLGAEISVNGVYQGVIPFTYRGAQGTYNYEISAQGYQTKQGSAKIRNGATTNVKVNLQVQQGNVHFDSSPQGAEVWINGVLFGTTPYTVARPTTVQESFELRLPGYLPVTGSYTAVAGQQIHMGPYLMHPDPSQLGSFMIGTPTPNIAPTDVELNNVPQQYNYGNPIAALQPGQYTYRVWNRFTQLEETGVVNIVAGQTATINPLLAPSGACQDTCVASHMFTCTNGNWNYQQSCTCNQAGNACQQPPQQPQTSSILLIGNNVWRVVMGGSIIATGNGTMNMTNMTAGTYNVSHYVNGTWSSVQVVTIPPAATVNI